jgi:hypothetical protein
MLLPDKASCIYVSPQGTPAVLLNPKPHGCGLICPRYFLMPVTQKDFYAKNRQK